MIPFDKTLRISENNVSRYIKCPGMIRVLDAPGLVNLGLRENLEYAAEENATFSADGRPVEIMVLDGCRCFGFSKDGAGQSVFPGRHRTCKGTNDKHTILTLSKYS